MTAKHDNSLELHPNDNMYSNRDKDRSYTSRVVNEALSLANTMRFEDIVVKGDYCLKMESEDDNYE